jgi:hypothetical protein
VTWLRWDTDAAFSDVVGDLVSDLRLHPAQVFGHYVATCLGFGQHRPDGIVTTVSDAALEGWARWTGKAGRWAAAFRARCVDPDGVIRGWWRNSALLRKQEMDAKKRKPPKNPRGFVEGTPEKPPGYVVTSRSVSSVGERGPGKTPSVRALLPADALEAFDGLHRAAHNPAAFVGAVAMLPEEVHGATWAHVGVALRDLALGGKPASGLALREFTRKAMETPSNGMKLPKAPEDEFARAKRELLAEGK